MEKKNLQTRIKDEKIWSEGKRRKNFMKNVFFLFLKSQHILIFIYKSIYERREKTLQRSEGKKSSFSFQCFYL